MDHLFARMKGRIEKYEKILSGKTIYERPEDIENAVEYDVDYKRASQSIDNFISKLDEIGCITL